MAQDKYFAKQLLAKSNEIDLSNIFPDKQKKAKELLNTNYSLPEIVDWIKENTNNFKKSEGYYIDLDQALQRIVFKYYDSTNQVNPFSDNVNKDVESLGVQPRLPAEVTSEGVKMGKPDIKSPETVVEKVVEQVSDGIESIKSEIEYMESSIEYLKTLPPSELDEETSGFLEYLQDEIKLLSDKLITINK